jgi:mannosyltransferase OCH1-like enzyme
MRVDSIRAFWMYFCGGIYSDLDIVPTSDFSFFFKNNDNSVYLVKTANIESTTNCIFASKRYSEFWLEYIQTMIERFVEWHLWKLSPHFNVIFNTGPQAITFTVKNHKYPVCYLPDCLISRNLTNPEIKNEIYTCALKGQSWNRFDSKFLLFFYVNRKFFIFTLILFHLYLYFKFLFL